MTKPKLGDIFKIPLSDGKMAYGRYLFYSKMGPIIEVFDFISHGDASMDDLSLGKLLFPPVITGLFAALRDHMWNVIGNRRVIDFVQPKFVSASYDRTTGAVRKWSLWDGESFTSIGDYLPSEYKELEFLVVWNPINVVRRIETGEMPFPYADLIKYNKYTPRPKTDRKKPGKLSKSIP